MELTVRHPDQLPLAQRQTAISATVHSLCVSALCQLAEAPPQGALCQGQFESGLDGPQLSTRN